MKNLFLIILICIFSVNANSQIQIATSFSTNATKNHNQRKIVRDYDHNIFVFYEDVLNGSSAIYFVCYDSLTSIWSQPEFLTFGNSPAAAIGPTDSIYIAYLSNDLNNKVMLMKKIPGGNWFPPFQISMADSLLNNLPVADVDNEGRIVIAWIEKGSIEDKIIFYKNGLTSEIYSSESITDLSLATDLLYSDERIFIAIEEFGNRVKFFQFYNIEDMEVLLDTLGTKPCQSIGVYAPGLFMDLFPRLMYIDNNNNVSLASIIFDNNFVLIGPYTLVEGPIDDIAIDDILQPIGFSFLYSDADGLYHSFAGHSDMPDVTLIDWLPPIYSNSSIAYKHFSATIVDFIWVVGSGGSYPIYYKRSNKIPYNPGTNIKTNNATGDITLWLSPNPFKDRISFTVTGTEIAQPEVKIYDLRGSLIKVINVDGLVDNGNSYSFQWNGQNESGSAVKTGTYILNITMGKSILNNLIVKE